MDLIPELINLILIELDITTITKYQMTSLIAITQVKNTKKYLKKNIKYYVYKYNNQIELNLIKTIFIGNKISNIFSYCYILDMIKIEPVYIIKGLIEINGINIPHGKKIEIINGTHFESTPYYMGKIHGKKVISYHQYGIFQDNIEKANNLMNMINENLIDENLNVNSIEYKAGKRHGICKQNYMYNTHPLISYSYYSRDITNNIIFVSKDGDYFFSEINYSNGKPYGLNYTVFNNVIVNMLYYFEDYYVNDTFRFNYIYRINVIYDDLYNMRSIFLEE